jgi:hypothetical protein
VHIRDKLYNPRCHLLCAYCTHLNNLVCTLNWVLCRVKHVCSKVLTGSCVLWSWWMNSRGCNRLIQQNMHPHSTTIRLKWYSWSPVSFLENHHQRSNLWLSVVDMARCHGRLEHNQQGLINKINSVDSTSIWALTT